MKRLLTIGLSLVFVLGAAACGGGGDAGDQESTATGQKAGAQQQPRMNVADSTLLAFIEASLELESFQQEMRSRMQEASGQEEGQEVRQQLMQERDSIIEAAGLSGPERYDSVMQAIKTSDAVQERYTTLRDSVESDSAAADTAS